MGRVLVCAALAALFFCGSLASAARHHENFSQGTYYDKVQTEDEKPVRVETDDPEVKEKDPALVVDEKEQPASVDTNIPDRYPKGYPGQEKYNVQFGDETSGSGYKPVGYMDTNAQFSSVDGDKTEEIPNRYPHGYPGSDNPLFNADSDPEAKYQVGKYYSSFSSKTDSSKDGEIPNRYPNGYYGNAGYEAETQGEADVYIRGPKHSSFSASLNAETKFDPNNRYPHGYYPDVSTDNGFFQGTDSSKFQQNHVSYQQFPDNQPRFGYEGIEGDFSTQFPKIPYELTGGACPSQYWVSKPQNWPVFFSVNSKVTDAFGMKAAKYYGETSILDALTDTRVEPYSRLVNSACTAILNSYSRAQYHPKHASVIESFLAALESPEAAGKQADLFEKANVSVFSAGISGSCT